jgi:TolB protein
MSGGAHAALTIEIEKGDVGAVPIAVVPFAWEGKTPAPLQPGEIVATDLRRSGRFSPLPDKDLVSRPKHAQEVNYQTWRAFEIDNMVVGRMEAIGKNEYRIDFQLLDVVKGQQMAGYSIRSSTKDLRRAVHQISDIVFEALTGIRGAFDTRIAYVTVGKSARNPKVNEYRLAVSDVDGYNEQILVKSQNPILSPAWSPDGQRMAYVSVTKKGPVIFVQNIQTRRARKLKPFPGLNNAPAWSPDGRKLAVTLSKDGNPEIYIYELSTDRVSRVTRSYGIDIEPAWLPDGSGLVFTSDRGGTPQLYRATFGSYGRRGKVERLTFEGDYNARASVSFDGKRVAFIHNHHVAIMDLESKDVKVLTETPWDESPSFAPNASMVIYATQEGRTGVLAAISADGRAPQKLSIKTGDIREPSWSPFRKRSK